jgi:hypothetical protein
LCTPTCSFPCVRRGLPQIPVDIMVQRFHLYDRNSQRPGAGFRYFPEVLVVSAHRNLDRK